MKAKLKGQIENNNFQNYNHPDLQYFMPLVIQFK